MPTGVPVRIARPVALAPRSRERTEPPAAALAGVALAGVARAALALEGVEVRLLRLPPLDVEALVDSASTTLAVAATSVAVPALRRRASRAARSRWFLV